MDKYNVLKYQILILLLCIQTGCCVVEIHGEGKVERSTYFGVLSIHHLPEGNVNYVRTTSLGLMANYSKFILGFEHESFVSIIRPNECSAIIIVNTNEQLDNLKQIVEINNMNLNNLCIKSMEVSK